MKHPAKPLTELFPQGYPEVLAQMGYAAARILQDYGITPDDVPALTFAVIDEIRKEVGGTSFYVPRGQTWVLSQRDEQIYAAFKGDNYSQLAHQYDMTVMHVRNIVKQGRARDLASRQKPLF